MPRTGLRCIHQRNHLEKLPPEVQTMILWQLPSIESLYSLIGASPRYCQLYFASKDKILSELIPRLIQPEIFVDALAAVKVPSLDVEEAENVAKFMRVFVEDGRKVDHSTVPLPPSTVQSLVRIHRSVEYLVEECFQHKFATLESCRESIGLSPSSEPVPRLYAEMSVTEEGRLQRAFYRLEIYRHLPYSVRTANPTRFKPDWTGTDCAIYMFPPWQVEELSCVYQYVKSRLADVLVGVDPRLIKYTKHACIEHMASLGLTFLRRIFRAKGEQRAKLLKENCKSSPDFLTKILNREGTPTVDEGGSGNTYSKLRFDGDDLNKPNHAWLWAYDDKPVGTRLPGSSEFLGHWGAVIWDGSRLKASGILGLA
ncbi:MAG: hypothetical protein M1816_005569 [Peltula sp. TS41687]|nr:MAG: hypothetical protein M1816_005569 [Peltula sp. TS41687]